MLTAVPKVLSVVPRWHSLKRASAADLVGCVNLTELLLSGYLRFVTCRHSESTAAPTVMATCRVICLLALAALAYVDGRRLQGRRCTAALSLKATNRGNLSSKALCSQTILQDRPDVCNMCTLTEDCQVCVGA